MSRLRTLLAAVATVTVLSPAPAPAAVYAGQLREAAATFRLRGIDGHALTLALTARSSGLGGTSNVRELEMVVTDCAGTKCATRKYVTQPGADEYGESTDLSITYVTAKLGNIVVQVAWSSDAGFGQLPPATATASGAQLATKRQARAVLLAGPVVEENYFIPVARCEDGRGEVRSAIGVSTAERPAVSWPATPPPGLRVKAGGPRVFTCR
jgi:hypothetical protein